jgi:hypothetical protein
MGLIPRLCPPVVPPWIQNTSVWKFDVSTADPPFCTTKAPYLPGVTEIEFNPEWTGVVQAKLCAAQLLPSVQPVAKTSS